LLKGEYTNMPPRDFYQYLLAELPEEEAKKYTAQLENHSTACWYASLTYPGYKYIPTTCLIPDTDLIIATNIQKDQVAKEEKEGVKSRFMSCRVLGVRRLSVFLIRWLGF
jgi:hypothetical protein